MLLKCLYQARRVGGHVFVCRSIDNVVFFKIILLLNVLSIHVSAISWPLYENVLVLGEHVLELGENVLVLGENVLVLGENGVFGDLIGKHSQKWETSHCELNTNLDRILSERRTTKLLDWKDSLLFCGPFKHFNQPCTHVIFINAWWVCDYSV